MKGLKLFGLRGLSLVFATMVATATEFVPGAEPIGLGAPPPRVVETTPTMGQRDVSPMLAAIQVRFDQPMNETSWSWCGGGYSYPEITGSPRFLTPYIAELPVNLEPQHSYSLSINCNARNFRSAEGVPAEPTPLTFRAGFAPGTFPTSNAANFKAWQEFQQYFNESYSYRDRTGTDWAALFRKETGDILSAPTAEEWAMRVAELMRFADDPHLYFRLPDDKRVSTHTRRGWLNSNPKAIREMLPEYREVNPLTATARAGGIGYFAVHAWSYESAGLDEAAEALEGLLDVAVLIVDVRANGGGDELQAMRIASYFVTEPRVYEKHRFRDPEAPDGWGPIRERRIRPNAEHHFGGKVLLLQGPVCLSSNESFIMMMRQAPNVTTLGLTTGGSSANPRRYELSNGVTAVLPSWEAMTPEGVVLEGVGIAPDIEVTGDFREGDPVLERALELAKEFE